MTREELIFKLNNIRMEINDGQYIYTQSEIIDIIRSLQSEPCEDCVSRESLKVHLRERLYESALNNTDYTCVAAEVFEDIADNRLDIWLSELSSVTPTRKTGHWIADVDRWGDVVTTVNGYRCSECGEFNTDKDNYCPNCGAEMESGE